VEAGDYYLSDGFSFLCLLSVLLVMRKGHEPVYVVDSVSYSFIDTNLIHNFYINYIKLS